MAGEIHISTLAESPWAEWLRCSETQLYHYYEPEQGIFIAESPNVIERAMNACYQPISFLIDSVFYSEQVQALVSRSADIPAYLAETAVLNSITGMHLTRGVLCAMRRRAAVFDPAMLAGMHRIAVLENVMNPTNLGAIFRSAAALGMDAVLLTSGCTDPLYRRAARVSMGTVFQIPWTFIGDRRNPGWPHPGLEKLRELGFKTAAMALKKESVSVSDPVLMGENRLAVILGTEGDGLAAETIAECDYTVMIPMFHGVDSLNVAAASAVAFWQLGHSGSLCEP